MKRLIFAAALIATTAPALSTDVGVSVSIGQPGFYGRVDIGAYPPPRLVYTQPMIIERGPVRRPPIYVNVPPGHARHWGRYCGRYGACGQPVYFVQNSWYQREYVPYYRRAEYRRDDRHRHGHERWDGPRGRQYGYDGYGKHGYRGGKR